MSDQIDAALQHFQPDEGAWRLATSYGRFAFSAATAVVKMRRLESVWQQS
jgi:hypothetical protein